MDELRLAFPCEELLASYRDGCREIERCGAAINGAHKADDYHAWSKTLVRDMQNCRAGIGLPSGYVPYTILWLAEGGDWAGTLSIRHRLTEALERYGGHIGYFIRPSLWGKGFGTRMLAMALPYARDLGIDPALITCDDNNIASARVMEKNGGVLKDVIENTVEGKFVLTRRYWVPTTGRN